MFIDHERAKNANERVVKQVTVSVNLPEGLADPEISVDISDRVYVLQHILYSVGKIEDHIKERLKKLSGDEAWQKVLDELFKKVSDKKRDSDNFRAWAVKFPSMLITCGLLQTVAFYEEKAVDIYNLLKGWLFIPDVIPWPDTSQQRLTVRISELGADYMDIYRMSSREAMAYMTWVKRTVSVLIPE